MKLLFPFFLSIFICSFSISAQGIEFFHGTFKEALAKAKATEKVIFMDAYAQWCGPCKRMAATTFKDENIGKFFNDNFINLKIDWESPEAADVRDKYSVNAYPTLFFIDENGKTVKQIVGGQTVESLMAVAKTISNKVDNSKSFEDEYNKGNRDPKLILNYIKALNRAGKSSLKVTNDYINKQKNLTTPENLKIILEGTTEADSKAYDLLIKYKKEIIALESEKAVNDKIAKACGKTAQKAVQFDSKTLLQEAHNKFKEALPAQADSFKIHTTLDFCKNTGDASGYCKACKDKVAMMKGEKNPELLHSFATEIESTFPKDKDAMSDAEKLAKKAADLGNKAVYYYTYSSILLKNGNKKDALKNANKCLELAQKEKLDTSKVEQLIRIIKEG